MSKIGQKNMEATNENTGNYSLTSWPIIIYPGTNTNEPDQLGIYFKIILLSLAPKLISETVAFEKQLVFSATSRSMSQPEDDLLSKVH